MIKTAILVDGGFYLKRAKNMWGNKPPKERADELFNYCLRHLKWHGECSELYRIFYYDCPPAEKEVYNPLLDQTINLKNTDTYKWSKEFHEFLKAKRKLALRMGELSEKQTNYNFKYETFKKLCTKKITVDELTINDLELNVTQKGVDMKIGLDISSLSYKRLVNQIILISGDSDFVPAAKHARREGIDFILDPLWMKVKPGLREHIDGMRTCCDKPSVIDSNSDD